MNTSLIVGLIACIVIVILAFMFVVWIVASLYLIFLNWNTQLEEHFGSNNRKGK